MPDFGTDGIRGDISPEFAKSLGIAISRFGNQVVVGRDTRISGQELEDALVEGLRYGANVQRVGVVPTPALSYFTTDMGVMITASHNLMPDNGFKIFGRLGYKLNPAGQKRVQYFIGVPAVNAGGMEDTRLPGLLDHYIRRVSRVVRGLAGLKIVVDCANGATHRAAPEVYANAGAEVVAINTTPDGWNINQDCGSTNPRMLQEAVLTHRADLGIAHDGDGDRVIMVDANGQIVDGDGLLAVLAVGMKERDVLTDDTIVVTRLSNSGLWTRLREDDIRVAVTDVGDHHVAERLQRRGLALGGEPCGHIIIPKLFPSSDGILTAMKVMSIMVESGASLADLAHFDRIPQSHINIPARKPSIAAQMAREAIDEIVEGVGKAGRIIVRESGTEPVVRVMVEHPTDADGLAHEVATHIEQAELRAQTLGV